jgi:branched-chain amino acid transport system substrate-binding protein
LRYAVILLAAWLALACRAAVSAAEVAIGIAYPLSGPYAATGARNLLAAMTAVDHLNEDGGVLGQPVRLVSVDDRCGTAEAVDAAERLVNAGVVAVVGHMCSHSSLMAAAIYDIAGIVMISPSSTHPRLTEEGRPNVFRLIGRDDRQGAESGNLIAERWPEQRIGIVHDGSVYGQGLALETRRALRRKAIEVAHLEQYEPDQPDYSGLVERLLAGEIELLYVGGYGPDAGRIVADTREAGLDLQLIGGDGLGMDEFWAAAGEAGDGTIFSSFGVADGDVLDEVDSAARRAVLSDFAAGGLGAYAAIELWAAAATRAQTLEPKEVIRSLHHGRFDTVRGAVSFDDKGDLRDAAWAWQVWRQGRKVPLD